MKNLLAILSLVALMFSFSMAAEAAAPAAEKAPVAAKVKAETVTGKVVSVDAVAKTLTVAVNGENKTFTVKNAKAIAKLVADDEVKVTAKGDEAVKVAKVKAKKEKKEAAAPAAK